MDDSLPGVSAFLSVSVWLTGFSEVELQGTGMTDTYYSTLQAGIGQSDLLGFFNNWELIQLAANGNPVQLAQLIETQLIPATAYAATAQRIIAMWYTGQWFTDVSNAGSGTMINADAYQQTLMYVVAQAHPPGAKQPGYASWAEPPIDIPSN